MELAPTHGLMELSMLETMWRTKELVLVPWSILMGQSFQAFGKMECTRNSGKNNPFKQPNSLNLYRESRDSPPTTTTARTSPPTVVTTTPLPTTTTEEAESTTMRRRRRKKKKVVKGKGKRIR